MFWRALVADTAVRRMTGPFSGVAAGLAVAVSDTFEGGLGCRMVCSIAPRLVHK
jgi:hypothetical protein